MDYYKNLKCYICTSRTSAGIFLSGKIIDRKPYGKQMHTEVFENFQEAEKEFFGRYSDWVSKEDFHLNQLYQVKDKNMYSVFSTPYYVGMTYTENCYENAEIFLPADSTIPWWTHGLTYEEAVAKVKTDFVKRYGNPNLYIHLPIRIHRVIHLNDVKRFNKVG